MCQKTEYTPAKIGEYSQEIFPIFKTVHVAKKSWRIINIIASTWCENMLGYYLSMDNINIIIITQSSQVFDPSCVLNDIHGQVSIDTQSTFQSIRDGLPDQYLDDTQFRPTLDQHSVESRPNIDRLVWKDRKITDYQQRSKINGVSIMMLMECQ